MKMYFFSASLLPMAHAPDSFRIPHSVFRILGVLLLAGQLSAQTTLQVVTKNIRKTVLWKPGMELVVSGEKADVLVVPTDSASVIVSAELSAKHPSLDTATTDVAAWQFVVNTVGKKIYVRAYVGLDPKKPQPRSNFKATLVVQVPKACPVNLSNKFGKAKLEHLDGAVALNGEFCNFQLTDLQGNVDVESRYGQVEGAELRGAVGIRSKRTDVTLSQLAAPCRIDAEYGTLSIRADSTAGNLTIVGDKSNVNLQLPPRPHHNVQVRAQYGQVTAPAAFDTSGSSPNNQQAALQIGPDQPTVDVKTSFGNIRIEQ